MIGAVLFHVLGGALRVVQGLAAVPAQAVMDVAQEHANKCVRMIVHMVVKIRVPEDASILAGVLVQIAVNGNSSFQPKNQ